VAGTDFQLLRSYKLAPNPGVMFLFEVGRLIRKAKYLTFFVVLGVVLFHPFETIPEFNELNFFDGNIKEISECSRSIKGPSYFTIHAENRLTSRDFRLLCNKQLFHTLELNSSIKIGTYPAYLMGLLNNLEPNVWFLSVNNHVYVDYEQRKKNISNNTFFIVVYLLIVFFTILIKFFGHKKLW